MTSDSGPKSTNSALHVITQRVSGIRQRVVQFKSAVIGSVLVILAVVLVASLNRSSPSSTPATSVTGDATMAVAESKQVVSTSDWKKDAEFLYRQLHNCLGQWNLKVDYYKQQKERRAATIQEFSQGWFEGYKRIEAYQPEMMVSMDTRVGQLIDQGIYVVDPTHFLTISKCLVYTVGTTDFAFETGIVKLTNGNCEVHVFAGKDSGLKVPSGSSGIQIHPFSIGTQQGDGVRTLDQAMNALGHTGNAINILHVNCQYCEYDVMPKVFSDIENGKLDVWMTTVNLNDQDDAHTGQLHEMFVHADKADMRLYHKDPTVPGCHGVRCGKYSWISGRAAFHSHVVYRCPEFEPVWETLLEFYESNQTSIVESL